MKYWQAFIVAWALCTRVPLPNRWYPQQISSELQSLSAVFYPLVGLIIAASLGLLGWMLPTGQASLFSAVVMVTGWVLLTGAMHLDGLADSVDAYFASHKGEAVILDVFKDPACGPMAVVAIVMVLLLKVAAVSVLFAHQQWFLPLVAALVISRGLLFPFIALTPYVREKGLASDMALAPYRRVWWVSAGVLVLVTVAVAPGVGAWLLAAALLAYFWRNLWLTKIGGYVGDCLGALIELVEVLILTMAVLVLCF